MNQVDPQGSSAHISQPTENHVRMSRHRMFERIVASVAPVAPRIVEAVLALVLAWTIYR